MPALNKVMLIGYLGRDAELRYLANAQAMVTFSLAINDTKDKTTWVNASMFGERAEKVAGYLRKGSLIYIEGRWNNREWEHEGEKRRVSEVVAYTVELLGERDPEPPRTGDVDLDDLPFE